jgi:glycosyltransferase involved in cell wall biosynthesis
MKRLKVALMHFCFEDYTIELANALAEIVDLTLIQPEKVANFCRDSLNENVQVISFPKPRVRNPGNFWAMFTMLKIIRDLQPDVLHVQETNDPWYDLTLFGNEMPPLVTTIHDIFRHPGDRQNIFGADYTKRISFYRSQQIIVHAKFLKQILHQQFGLPTERIQVLANGEFGNLYQRRSNDLNASPEPYTLLFFGRVWPYKGLKYLLAALPIIAAKFPAVKLVIAGKGENLKNYFPAGYDPNQIEIINDFIPPSQVASIFQRSTIVVLPYIEASQSGVISLAYGMGKLVVASAVGGLQEVVRSGQDGLLVPPGDVAALSAAIIELFNDQQLQTKLRAGALARCTQDLDWHNVAWQTVNVYHQAITTKSKERVD